MCIKGVQSGARGDLLSIVRDRLPEYDISGGAQDTWKMAMKQSNLSDLKNKAVSQAIETIRNRIDQLGVSEPTIQEHGLGQYQILVQLPGVDDPGRVKDIMQSTAMLEIKQQLGGPYPSEQAALQDKGGILPADSLLLQGIPCLEPRTKGKPGIWSRAFPQSAEKTCATRSRARIRMGSQASDFTLTGEGGQRFYNFTSSHVGDSLAVVLDNKVQEVANIKEPIRDQRRN